MGADARRCCYATNRAALPRWSQWSQVNATHWRNFPSTMQTSCITQGSWDTAVHGDASIVLFILVTINGPADLISQGSVVIPQRTDAMQAAPASSLAARLGVCITLMPCLKSMAYCQGKPYDQHAIIFVDSYAMNGMSRRDFAESYGIEAPQLVPSSISSMRSTAVGEGFHRSHRDSTACFQVLEYNRMAAKVFSVCVGGSDGRASASD